MIDSSGDAGSRQAPAEGVGEQLALFASSTNDADATGVRDRPAIASRDRSHDDGGFSSGNYWSSTENNSSNAWNLNFSNGSWNNNNKNNTNYVRCVRRQSSASSPFHPVGEVTLEEVFGAYFACRRHKRNTEEQVRFELDLEANLIDLHEDIRAHRYRPGPSVVFAVLHPKPREVWAAQFRDRVVHHIIYRRLAPTYHRLFIADSYACIPMRGVHSAVCKAESHARSVTGNYTRPAWWIKADIANFFCTIDRRILRHLLAPSLIDDDLRYLVDIILDSDIRENAILRSSKARMARIPPHKSLWNLPDGRGLPIGNLTSQFFANVYLDALDRYAKRVLRAPRYLRYVDDILMCDADLDRLRADVAAIDTFLQENLGLSLHPDKTVFGRIHQGFDFLGFYCLPGRRYLRRSTHKSVEWQIVKRFREAIDGRIDPERFRRSVSSLIGGHSHANQRSYVKSVRARLSNLMARAPFDH